MASCTVIYIGVGLGAHNMLSTGSAAAKTVTKISGVAMVCIGLFLLAEELIV